MKDIFSLTLILIIFGNILSSKLQNKTKNFNMKVIKLIQKLPIIGDNTVEINDLILSDSSIEISDYISINKTDTKSEAYDIEETNGTNVIPFESDSITALQITKFFNFEGNKEERKIKYNLFLFFIGQPISKTIYIRLIIYYRRELTNTQSIPYIVIQSAPSICTIKEEYKDKIGKKGSFDNIIYNCESTITYLQLNVTTVTLDPNYYLLADDEEVSFRDINFDFDAVEEALNIVNAPNYKKFGSLDNAQVELPIQRNYFRINGILNPKDLLSQGDIIPFEIINYVDEEEYELTNISCNVINVDGSNCILECDTENKTIKCMTSNFTTAKSLDNNLYLKINMNQEETEIETPIQIIKNNKKSSGGISKGLIAGIVIGCVVVAAAIPIIIIIINRRRASSKIISKPIDNSQNVTEKVNIKINTNAQEKGDIKKCNGKIYAIDQKKDDIKKCYEKIKPYNEKIYKGNDNKV